MVCWHCGSTNDIRRHCKVICGDCGQLIVNCNGDLISWLP